MSDTERSPEEQAHLRILAAEYVELVDAMRNGHFDGDEEYQQLSSQRSLVHDELIRLTGLEERRAMYGYCRQLLSAAAGPGSA